MLTDNVIFYGETANKIRFLKDETNLFNRFLDVYIAGGVAGMLFNQTGENEVTKNKATIFADQISTESMRIKYFASLAFIIDNDDLNEEVLLKKAFSDWFSEDYEEDIKNNKYKLFKSYAIGGIDILYSEIVGESTDKESYLENFFKFLKKIDDEKIDDKVDRAILGGLMS